MALSDVTSLGVERAIDEFDQLGKEAFLEVWPESHRPGFALRQADVFQSYMAQ